METTVVEPVGIAYLQNSIFFEQNVKENNNANGDNNIVRQMMLTQSKTKKLNLN